MCDGDIVCRNGALRSRVPALLTPLLQKIGVVLGYFQDAVYGILGNATFLHFDRMDEGGRRSCPIERPDASEQKETFGVRFGFAHLSDQLRQSSTDKGDRSVVLPRTVQSGDQRRQFPLSDILKFIDEQNERGLSLAGRLPNQVHKIYQIGFEIAIISDANLA